MFNQILICINIWYGKCIIFVPATIPNSLSFFEIISRYCSTFKIFIAVLFFLLFTRKNSDNVIIIRIFFVFFVALSLSRCVPFSRSIPKSIFSSTSLLFTYISPNWYHIIYFLIFVHIFFSNQQYLSGDKKIHHLKLLYKFIVTNNRMIFYTIAQFYYVLLFLQ